MRTGARPTVIALAGQTSWQQKQVMQSLSLILMMFEPFFLSSTSTFAGHIVMHALHPMHLFL